MINVQISGENAQEISGAILQLANLFGALPTNGTSADEQFKRLSESRNALSARDQAIAAAIVSGPAIPTADTDGGSEALPAQAEKPKRKSGADKPVHITAAKEENVEGEAGQGEPSDASPSDLGKAQAAGGAEVTSTPEPQAASPSVAPAVEYTDVQKAVNSVAAKKGRDAAIKLLGEFNAANGKELAESQWAAFVARAEEVLA